MHSILSDLFVNFSIIIASLTLGNLIARDRVSTFAFRHKLILSILAGILGYLLMIFSVRITDSVIVDFRGIAILLMGIYCSFPAALVTSGIIGAFRVAVWGLNSTSLVALANILLMGIACGLIGKTKWNIRIKWLCSFLSVFLISTSGLVLVIRDPALLFDVLSAFFIGLFLVSFVTYHLLSFLIESNKSYFFFKEASTIDYLTGLNNVRHFDRTLNAYLSDAKNKKNSLSLLFIDIDFFKKINDIHGHLSGDKVLKQLGEILMKRTGDTDIVTRKGGEEFTVLLPASGLSEAMEKAERIRETIAQHAFIVGENASIRITVSIGVSSFPETTGEEDRLIEQADIALYHAKRTGRNKVSVANSECCAPLSEF